MSTQIIALLVIAVWVGIIGLGLLLGRLLIGTKWDAKLWRGRSNR